MASKEGFTGWTDRQKVVLRRALVRPGPPQSDVPQETNPGVQYSKLVSRAELADGVWHRETRRGHGFTLVLTNPSEETLHKAYQTEVELQAAFMLELFDFNLGFSALSDEEKAVLENNGYKWIPRVEDGAPDIAKTSK